MKNILVATLAFGLLAVTGSANANLISNGDFEANGGSLQGWTTDGSVTVQNAGSIADIQGMDHHYALLGYDTTAGSATLRQDFDLLNVDSLTVSFDWAFDVIDWSNSKDDVFISFIREGDTNSHRITMEKLKSSAVPQVLGVGAAWGHYEETFSISNWLDDEGRVVFRLRENASWATNSLAGIDNVSVTGPAPVPEPATMLLFGTGLLGLVGYSRKRAQKS